MRQTVCIFVLLLGALPSGFAQAQVTPVVPAPPSQPTPFPRRVATIFGQNAIASTQEGQKATAALTAKFAPRKEEYDRKQAEMLALRDQAKKSAATATAEARDRLNQQIDAKSREVKRLGEDSQAALEQEEGAMLQELGDKLLAVVRDYAARNSFAVVFDVSAPNGPVLWASPAVDITNEIVKLYDQAHPVAPAAPAAPPTKK